MPKKKRILLVLSVLISLVFGYFFGLWPAAVLLAVVAGVAGYKRSLRFVRAHWGVERLAAECGSYHMAPLAESLCAAEKPGEPFTFVVLGDNRATKRVPPEIFRHASEEKPRFAFNTGDLARYGAAHEYASRYLPLLRIMDPVPVFSVPGNHDRGARNDFSGFRAVHGDERFSFDFGSCRFVGVNNGKRARLDAADIAYLRDELSKSPARHRFVFLHVPPAWFEDGLVTVSKRRGFTALGAEFRALMAEQRVDEVFMGHIHGYASRVVDGVRYTLTAGAGAPLSQRLPEEARVHNYVVCHVDARGYRREVVRRIGGNWVRSADTGVPAV